MRTADSELLRRIKEGSEEAFVEFYERFKGPVFRFAFQMAGSIPLAEEITQEVFVIWIQEKCGYDEDRGSLAAYLFGIARNRVRRRLRRRARRQLTESAARRRDRSSGFPQEEQVLQSEKQRQIRRGVLALPERYREVVVLCDLQEFSYEQAAQVLDCKIGTVRSRLHRGRELLGRKLMENGQSVGLLNAVRNTQ